MLDLSAYSPQQLLAEEEIAVFRGRRPGDEAAVLLVATTAKHPSPSSVSLIRHAYSLRDELHPEWALRPLELLSPANPALLLEDPGGEFVSELLRLSSPGLEQLVRLSIAISKALGSLHARGLIHRDV